MKIVLFFLITAFSFFPKLNLIGQKEPPTEIEKPSSVRLYLKVDPSRFLVFSRAGIGFRTELAVKRIGVEFGFQPVMQGFFRHWKNEYEGNLYQANLKYYYSELPKRGQQGFAVFGGVGFSYAEESYNVGIGLTGIGCFSSREFEVKRIRNAFNFIGGVQGSLPGGVFAEMLFGLGLRRLRVHNQYGDNTPVLPEGCKHFFTGSSTFRKRQYTPTNQIGPFIFGQISFGYEF